MMSAAMEFFLETQEQVWNSRGKRAISVRATEVLLYFCPDINYFTSFCSYARPESDQAVGTVHSCNSWY